MEKSGQLPPETTFQEVQLKIRESYRNENVGEVFQVVLKEGPRAFRTATVFEIIDPKAGKFHHYSLRLDHIDRLKGGWFAKPEKSFRCEASEVDDLVRFLSTLSEGKLRGRTGDLHIVDAKDYEQLAALVGALDRLPNHDRLELTKALLTRFGGEAPSLQEFADTFSAAPPDTVATIALAARLVEYEAAVEQLELLIEGGDTVEHVFQKHLNANPWMFGSEYSELLDQRRWTRDDNLDYMLRRTVDGFLEIVEIKRALSTPLFGHDPKRDAYYPGAPLSQAIGQTIRYIEETERQRDAILAKDGEETLKVRARVIIGRDGDPRQVRALKALNAHLNQIEILTFDQLLRIARRVIAVFQPGEEREPAELPEPPF